MDEGRLPFCKHPSKGCGLEMQVHLFGWNRTEQVSELPTSERDEIRHLGDVGHQHERAAVARRSVALQVLEELIDALGRLEKTRRALDDSA